MLHPTLAAISQAASEASLPPLRTLEPVDARARIAALKRGAVAHVPGVTVEEGEIDRVPVRWYTPEAVAHGVTVVYLHSGGWVLGDLDAPDPMLRRLSAESGLRYVSVDYRLAPEHPFPSALDDVQTVVDAVAANGERFILHGDSAGGNLAAVIAGRLRGTPTLLGQVLVYPVVDCDTERPSYLREDLPAGFLEAEDMRWFWAQYAGDLDRTSPDFSPLRAELSGLPPTMVVTAEYDPLRDEGLAFASTAAHSGVDVRHLHMSDCAHGFMQLAGVLDRADECRQQIAATLRALLAASTSGQVG